MLSRQLRNGVATLANRANADLSTIWKHAATPTEVQAALYDVLPPLVVKYGSGAAVLAAEWYDQARAVKHVRGKFRADPVFIADPGVYALIGWAVKEATDLPAFQSLIEGGTQRRIANFSRATVTTASVADPHARGWQRVGAGNCDFCAMLIGRGAVYSEATADFPAHDHCACGAEPAWS